MFFFKKRRVNNALIPLTTNKDHDIPYIPIIFAYWCIGIFFRLGGSAVALFLSTFLYKIDKKGRVSVPATFRSALSNQQHLGIVLYPSLKHPSIEGSGIERFEKIADGIDDLNPFSDNHDDFTKAIFGQAYQLQFDREGRIIIPDTLLNHAKIDDHMLFVGQGRTFQIWEPSRFKNLESDLLNRVRENHSSINIKISES